MPKSKSVSKNRESKGKSKQDEEQYNKMNLHEHILHRPDSYVGSTKTDTKEMYFFDTSTNTIRKKKIRYNQAFYKIFDEIRVNAWDRTVKSKCDTIKIDLDMESGWISVTNTKDCPDIRKHKKEKIINKKTGKEEPIYVPHLIFGELLTSENYKNKGKITGGKNGYGAKCTNIYSKEFIVETVDHKQKIKYVQTFRNNMYDYDQPKITKSKMKESYCKISYLPDYERFGMKGMTKDMHGVLVKACYDLLVSSVKKIKVYLNGKELKIKNFDDYIRLYYPTISAKQIVQEKVNSRWNVAVVFVPDLTYSHASFVNGIYTKNGGTHVKYITDQITRGVKAHINKKKKYSKLPIRPAVVKDHIHVFVSAIIEDPDFESQTKEVLTSTVENFGKHTDSRCKLDEKFIKNVLKTGLENEVVKMSEFKANSNLTSSDGKKVAKIYDKKLADAYWAGTRKSDQCYLILTEGDSAATFAKHGLSIIGRERYGVFPLKGVPLNVDQCKTETLAKNDEFLAIKQHMGLKQEIKYDKEYDIKKLRYGGGLIILTDQDPDGYHIKGLIMQMFRRFWPHLLRRKGFIQTLNTPLTKGKKGKVVKTFYNQPQYDAWCQKIIEKEGNAGLRKWNVKYYKGLGTSIQKEAEECFMDFEKKRISFVEVSKKDSDDEGTETDNINPLRSETIRIFSLLFSKKESDGRKEWLNHYDENDYIDTSRQDLTYNEFFDKEYRRFSKYSCKRAVPSIMDGWKPSQRKIYYGMVKRGRNKGELKVAQLSGYVSENAEYHHGEASLQGAIIKMAQNFPGSNNLNVLFPSGEFGTRTQNGDDAASPRYIFTKLEEIMIKVFRPEDDPVLKYVNEDGHIVEPIYYGSIFPMCLVNGVAGIGTGWSTYIPSFNPKDVINNIRRKLKGEDAKPLVPWFKGYPEKLITEVTTKKFVCEGEFEIRNNTVIITNIPLGQQSKSIEKYTEFLYNMLEKGKKDPSVPVVDVTEKCGPNKIHFEVEFKSGSLKPLLHNNCKDLIKLLALSCNINLTNMTLHNPDGEIIKYDSVEQIIDNFYDCRYKIYKARRKYRIKELENRLNIIDYKIKYIEHVNDDTIQVKKTTTAKLIAKLEKLKYPRLHNDHTVPKEDRTYDYITNIRVTSLTIDEIKRLKEERKKRKNDLRDYKSITIEELWGRELDEFEEAYDKWLVQSLKSLEASNEHAGKGKGKAKAKGRVRKKK